MLKLRYLWNHRGNRICTSVWCIWGLWYSTKLRGDSEDSRHVFGEITNINENALWLLRLSGHGFLCLQCENQHLVLTFAFIAIGSLRKGFTRTQVLLWESSNPEKASNSYKIWVSTIKLREQDSCLHPIAVTLQLA